MKPNVSEKARQELQRRLKFEIEFYEFLKDRFIKQKIAFLHK